MNKTKIYLSPPHLGKLEKKYVNEALDSNWIAPLGPHVNNFEKEICKKINVGNSAVVSSGTAAIHLALLLLGIKPKDIVLCQSFTFVGSVNPVAYLGATPVFIDSEADSWNLDPVILRKAILHYLKKKLKPKAMIVVHLYGMPAKIHEIQKISKEFDVPIIEDAAEALGSSINNQKCGSFGDCGILSFNGNKVITTSGGGALLSNDKKLIEKAKFLATQSRDPADHYEHSEIGYNYRMSNILAAVGRAQLKVLDDRVKARRNNFLKYKEFFLSKKGITLLEENPNKNENIKNFSNRWLTNIIVDSSKTNGITKENIRKALLEQNIESRPLWKPMHLQPIFQKSPFFGSSVSEKLFNNGLCLPSGSNLSDKDFKKICDSINKVL